MRRLFAGILTGALLTALLVGVGDSPASAASVTARSLLLKLSVASETGGTTYSRTSFRHWVDADGDCQDTRAEVLVAESTVTPSYSSGGRCTVSAGRWYSSYDGATWTNPGDVDIDHVLSGTAEPCRRQHRRP